MTEVIRLDVQGMSCSSCAARIEKKLNKLDGVNASVNYATERAVVEAPEGTRELGPGSWQEELIGPAHTPCFRLRRSHLAAPLAKTESEASIVIVTSGSCSLSAGGETHALRFGDKVFLPAGLGPVALQPANSGCVLLECLPPLP